MDLKKRFTEKSYGFYVLLSVVLLTLVTSIVYAVNYHKLSVYMSWASVIVMWVGVVAALVLSFLRLDEFATGALALANLVGLLLFVKVIYGYVAVVLVGIDLNSFDAKFIACTVLFALSFVSSAVTVFLPQRKKEKED